MRNNPKRRDSLKIRLHSIMALVLLLHSIFYLVYWFSIGNLKVDVDSFITDVTGFALPFTTILIFLTIGIGLWSLIRFTRMRLALRKGDWEPSAAGWIFSGIWVAFLGLFYYSFFLILKENPSQKGVLYQLINLIRVGTDPFIFLIMAIFLRKMILDLRRRAVRSNSRWVWSIGIGVILLVLVGLWVIPAIFPPNWAYQGELPAKPALISHRGASMLAPENTTAAADLAADYDAFGFETDVRISWDGEPFLMHDQTLERTTNVAEVFPDRAGDDASSFTIAELQTLNAGLWFIQSDPYNTIETGLISQSQLSINQGQKIPTLAQALELVDQQNLVILFDMRYPPQDHPFHDQFFEIVFDLCKESGVNGNIWFLVDREHLNLVLEEAPQMTRVTGVSSTYLPDPGTLIDLNYEIVNVDAGVLKDEIENYRKEGLGVNVYTIDQPWLFSQFWLSGVTSITTNNINQLSRLEVPTLNLSYSRFLLFWGLFGIIVAIWIASSQPEILQEQQKPEDAESLDLMDFAMEETSKADIRPKNDEKHDNNIDTISEVDTDNRPEGNPVDKEVEENQENG